MIRVVVRFRPLGEGRDKSCELVKVDPIGNFVAISNAKATYSVQRFDFERVCDEHEDNESLARTVGRPLVEQVAQGYNGTLMAYGQTGAGKSFNIVGTPSQPGSSLTSANRLHLLAAGLVVRREVATAYHDIPRGQRWIEQVATSLWRI